MTKPGSDLKLRPMKSTRSGPHIAKSFSHFCLAGVIALATISGCTRFQLLNATVPHSGYTRDRDISYGALPRQKLDVYRPTSGAGPSDVIIFFHGGSWQSGQKEDYRFVAQALASRGFVAVIPNYRLYPQVAFPTFVQDAAAAVRWVYDNVARFGGDPERIFLMGHSAGAHIAVILTLDGEYLEAVGLSRSAIRATAGLSGPYDFVPSASDRGVFSMPLDEKTPDPRIEPISFVDGRAPPMLLVQGCKDETVDPANASRLADRIRVAGGEVRTIFYPSRAHVDVVLAFAFPFRWLAPVLTDTTTFFREHESNLAAPSPATSSP